MRFSLRQFLSAVVLAALAFALGFYVVKFLSDPSNAPAYHGPGREARNQSDVHAGDR